MNNCIACKKVLAGHDNPSRCSSCAKKGELHPLFKGGKPKCIDCEKRLGHYDSIRCNSCSMIRKIKLGIVNTKGINNPAYKHGKYIQNLCKCGKKITPNAKRCCKCEGIEISIRMRGNHNPNWKGGYNIFYYSKIFKKIRKVIRKKYRDICQLCFKFGKIVHHIDYNKENNHPSNLIILCSKCHSKVNFNRDYWYAYFMYITEKE
jgi:5-methylcytosine-specific restriction endonuclease McrA